MSLKQVHFPDIAGFFAALRSESDRAAGILGAALLDQFLEHLFRARLAVETPESVFAFRGPLGDFAARIDLAFALGWFDADTQSDLHVIRGIRNSFAHSSDHGLTFSDQSIAARTRNLNTVRYLAGQIDLMSAHLPEMDGKAEAVAASKAQLGNGREMYTGAIMQLAEALATLSATPLAIAVPPLSLQDRFDSVFLEALPQMLADARQRRESSSHDA